MNIFSLHRLHGHFDPSHATRVGLELLEQNSESAVLLAASLLRQAADLSPYYLDLENMANLLASKLNRSVPFADTTNSDPAKPAEINSRIKALGNNIDGLHNLYKTSSSARLRHACLTAMWQQGLAPELFLANIDSLPKQQVRSKPFFAWGAFRLGHIDLARKLLKQMSDSWLALNLYAQMALEENDIQKARSYWQQSLELEPAQPHLIERLAQLKDDHTSLPNPDDFKVHILFYTYNKLETTLTTLRTLLTSNIGAARITLLNNGSINFSHEEFQTAVNATACGREVELIQLPVNIGAPAARNWLYQLPSVQNSQFVVFLDDDVELPADWLRLYLQDMLEYPEICAVGPKVLNPDPYRTVQYVYRYFEEAEELKIRFTYHCPMPYDLGQFSGRRPCLSVMGCCHLFDRKKLQQLGVPDFDVRFTPSQVDDLERDIQIWKHGGRILYDGRVEVIHLQGAGQTATKTEAAWGHVWGNHMKMEAKFTGRELHCINERVTTTEHNHWQSCLYRAWEAIPPSCRSFWQAQHPETRFPGAGS